MSAHCSTSNRTVSAATRKDAATRATPQHRHFAEIARIIAAMPRVRNLCTRTEIAINFADALHATDPRFDRQRFLRACEGE